MDKAFIRDVRVTPYPADFAVIQNPGNFTGWSLSFDYSNRVYNTVLRRIDSREVLAMKLRKLAEELEAGL